MSFTIQHVTIKGMDDTGRLWTIENDIGGITLIPGDSFELTWKFEGENTSPRKYRAVPTVAVPQSAPKTEAEQIPEVQRRVRRSL